MSEKRDVEFDVRVRHTKLGWGVVADASWWQDDSTNEHSDYMVPTLCDTPAEALSLAVAWLEENVGVRLPEAPDAR